MVLWGGRFWEQNFSVSAYDIIWDCPGFLMSVCLESLILLQSLVLPRQSIWKVTGYVTLCSKDSLYLIYSLLDLQLFVNSFPVGADLPLWQIIPTDEDWANECTPLWFLSLNVAKFGNPYIQRRMKSVVTFEVWYFWLVLDSVLATWLFFGLWIQVVTSINVNEIY